MKKRYGNILKMVIQKNTLRRPVSMSLIMILGITTNNIIIIEMFLLKIISSLIY